jgi:hypothetical protein
MNFTSSITVQPPTPSSYLQRFPPSRLVSRSRSHQHLPPTTNLPSLCLRPIFPPQGLRPCRLHPGNHPPCHYSHSLTSQSLLRPSLVILSPILIYSPLSHLRPLSLPPSPTPLPHISRPPYPSLPFWTSSGHVLSTNSPVHDLRIPFHLRILGSAHFGTSSTVAIHVFIPCHILHTR